MLYKEVDKIKKVYIKVWNRCKMNKKKELPKVVRLDMAEKEGRKENFNFFIEDLTEDLRYK